MLTALYLAGFATVLLAVFVTRSRRRRPLPPGPPSDPLIGHLRLLPKENQGTVFHQWAQSYGDVVCLRVIGRIIVVLDSVAAAVDLLEKRSSIYSDRPKFTIYELMQAQAAPNVVILPYGRRFRKHRKILQSNFTRAATYRWRDMQTVMARRLVKMLLVNSEDYSRLISWFTAALTLRIAYGLKIVSEDDEYVKAAEESSHLTNNSGPPGGTPVDLLPFLKHMPNWFPGTFYADFARRSQATVKKFYDIPFEKVQNDMAEGIAEPSVTATELNRLKQTGSMSEEDIQDIKGAAAVIFGAGAETTWATMLIFILTVILHPEVQKRAQDEIDQVVGRDRLPDFSDYDSLPYLECLVHEVLRWYPVAPLGVPHRCMEDDIYRGMLIPKGTTVIANLRGMSLDETVYKDPKDFNPSRFLPKPAGNGEPFFDSVFGFGRRICPGRHLAFNSIWIIVATILATSNISKAVGDDGREIDVVPEFLYGIVSRPKDFPCRITSRYDDAMTILSVDEVES